MSIKAFHNIVFKKFDWENYIYKCILVDQYVNDNTDNEDDRKKYYNLIVENLDVFNYMIKYEVFRNDKFIMNVLDIINDRGLAKVLKSKIKDRPDLGKDERYGRRVLFEFNKTINQVPISDNAIGLDYKSDGLYADSNGNVCGSPKYYRKSQKKLAKLQRQLSRKEKGSNNRNKARLKVAKLQKHTANQRLDFLHKKSTEIANQYDVVCVESLDMKNMSNKGFGNGKATLDNGYGLFLTMLEYKLADRGKYFVKVDKWYPSSQLCYCCGKQHKEMKNLLARQFVCGCGYKNDRDTNASLNIKKEGLRLLTTV